MADNQDKGIDMPTLPAGSYDREKLHDAIMDAQSVPEGERDAALAKSLDKLNASSSTDAGAPFGYKWSTRTTKIGGNDIKERILIVDPALVTQEDPAPADGTTQTATQQQAPLSPSPKVITAASPATADAAAAAKE